MKRYAVALFRSLVLFVLAAVFLTACGQQAAEGPITQPIQSMIQPTESLEGVTLPQVTVPQPTTAGPVETEPAATQPPAVTTPSGEETKPPKPAATTPSVKPTEPPVTTPPVRPTEPPVTTPPVRPTEPSLDEDELPPILLG